MKTKYLIILLAICSNFLVAQKRLADKFFSNYGYVKASELYEETVKKGDSSEFVLTRLGDCYYNNSETEKAMLWYSKAVNKYPEINPEYIFKYIQTLKSLGNYAEADKWMKKFIHIQNKEKNTKEYNVNSLAMYSELLTKADNSNIEVLNLPINSNQSDFGTFIHDNQLYFASAKSEGKTKLYAWNKEPFLDIFQVSVSENDNKLEFGEPELIKASKINTYYHDSSVAITKDGNTIYFTRDNVIRNRKIEFDKKGTTHLKIFKATKVKDKWDDIEELPFNDDVFSTGHPVLSPDNKKLYFVSDRDGGIGQTDIYEVDILGNNNYSQPKNMGDKINTTGREMFPFISKDSIFYFSSDGYLNLGLLDIYKSTILKDNNAEPENLGVPYNSGFDDFAFYLDPLSKNKRGYFSSNRPGGQGNDDIYSFTPGECNQIVKGIVRDKDSNEILSGVKVQLINETGKVIEEIVTTINGEYQFEAKCNKKYTILGSKITYTEDKRELVLDKENNKITVLDLFLDPLIKGTQIVVNPIYFDYDKSNIRTDAEYELEKIVDVLRTYPAMVIKIESHTDSRGKDEYNLRLSDERAKSTRDYILSRGISTNRIESAIGFGETQLLNKCGNNVKCSEAEHQMNRRSYFYILKK